MLPYPTVSNRETKKIPGWTAVDSIKNWDIKFVTRQIHFIDLVTVTLQNHCDSFCNPCYSCLRSTNVKHCSQICNRCWSCDPVFAPGGPGPFNSS